MFLRPCGGGPHVNRFKNVFVTLQNAALGEGRSALGREGSVGFLRVFLPVSSYIIPRPEQPGKRGKDGWRRTYRQSNPEQAPPALRSMQLSFKHCPASCALSARRWKPADRLRHHMEVCELRLRQQRLDRAEDQARRRRLVAAASAASATSASATCLYAGASASADAAAPASHSDSGSSTSPSSSSSSLPSEGESEGESAA